LRNAELLAPFAHYSTGILSECDLASNALEEVFPAALIAFGH